MGTFVVYILEWSACLLCFLLLYRQCFSGTTFHRFNRCYLLGSVLVSAILPLIHIAPSEQIEPMAEACRTVIQVEDSTLGNISIHSAFDANTTKLTAMEIGAMVLLVIYLMYVIIQIIGWSKSMLKLFLFMHGKQRVRIGKWVWLVKHNTNYEPFSWMNCIIISTHEQGFGRRAIMQHELSHIILLHHMDLAFLMMCVLINPTCWIVMKEIKKVHEYEADDEVIHHYGVLNRDYQRLLLMRTVGAEAYALASSFNSNIKKRIMMMKKKQSHWWRMIWIAVTIPFTAFTLMAFSKPKEAFIDAVNNSVRILEQPLIEVMQSDLFETEPSTPLATPYVEEIQQQPEQAPFVMPGDIIKGCVKNENGQPLELANIVEQDEYHRIVAHTTTDKNGNFSFKVINPQHKIYISYVGYKTTSLDIIDSKINVTLEPNTQVRDVTVVGVKDNIDFDSPRYKEQNNPDSDLNILEQAPSFPGGHAELLTYLNNHLNYPSVAKEMRVEANITVRFMVDKTGFIRAPQVVQVTSKTPLITAETQKAAKEGNDEAVEVTRNYDDAVEAMKEEAIYVVRNMPRWEPGRQNGKRIETTYTLPITFQLQ